MTDQNGSSRKDDSLSRRGFLGVATAAAAFTIVPRHVLGGPNFVAPSEKLNIAGIGIGGMGGSNVANVASENIVALCDVDDNNAAKCYKKFPKAKTYRDFRVMLDKQKDIDAVVIGTPDHTHAVISMVAIQAGKHVYCQKPLTHDVYEARMLAKAAKEKGVVTQMGIQGHSGEGIRLICEWIWDGAIGEVREVDTWCSLTYYPWGHAYWSSPLGRRPKETPPVPATLDWDLFLGPAPVRPYHPCYHPGSWRAWWDFGCGMMGDRGAHTFDPVFTALKLGAPTSVEASSTELNPDTHPIAALVRYQFPARGDLPPVTLTWYDGLRPPRPRDLETGRSLAQINNEGGAIFKGSKGTIVCGVYGNSPRIIPESKMKEVKLPGKTIPRVATSHEMDWVRCCKEGQQPGAHFGYSGPLTEACLLGNVAKRLDRQILWDAESLKVTNIPEAEALIRTPYREGWSL